MPFNADDNNQNNQDDNNINKNKQNENSGIGLAGSGGQTGPSTVGSGRIANYSSGQPQAQQGSGRFTNLQKYINANQGSGERLGNRIGQKYDDKLNRQTSDINSQNNQIAQNIQQGRQALDEGTGFTNQLKGIGEGFNTFKSFDDRQGFDDAATRASQFASAPTFNRFQTIQSGDAIDNEAAMAAQNAATLAGQNLGQFTGDRLQKIGNDQGRYDLLKDTFGNKKNYSSGNARFDQLFLQNDPTNPLNTLQNKFNQGNLQAGQLQSAIGTQGENVNKLLQDETGIVTGINDQAKATQDAFNTALYGEQNLANNLNYVNTARDANFANTRTGLQNRTLSQEEIDMLGLSNINRYDPRFGYNPEWSPNMAQTGDVRALGASGKMTTPGSIGAPEFDNSNPNIIGTYNLLNDPYAVDQYIKKGKSAVSAQDITTDDDYNAYKALQNISGIDSGKVAGASQLGASILQGDKNLADEINAADANFSNLDESGGLQVNTQNNRYRTVSPQLSTILNLRDQITKRGNTNQNPFAMNNFQYSTDVKAFLDKNADILNPLGSQATYAPGTYGRGFTGTDNYQDRMASVMDATGKSLQNVIDKGYDNTIKVDPTRQAPKRYKGLL